MRLLGSIHIGGSSSWGTLCGVAEWRASCGGEAPWSRTTTSQRSLFGWGELRWVEGCDYFLLFKPPSHAELTCPSELTVGAQRLATATADDIQDLCYALPLRVTESASMDPCTRAPTFTFLVGEHGQTARSTAYARRTVEIVEIAELAGLARWMVMCAQAGKVGLAGSGVGRAAVATDQHSALDMLQSPAWRCATVQWLGLMRLPSISHSTPLIGKQVKQNCQSRIERTLTGKSVRGTTLEAVKHRLCVFTCPFHQL